MAPFNHNALDFSVHYGCMNSSMNSLHGGRLSGRSSARNSFDLNSSVHGRAVPLKDALDLSIHGLRPALDLTCHSTGHPQQDEFDAIMAVIGEGRPINLDEIVALFEENRADLPPYVVDFVENRLGRFQRNVGLVQETLQEEIEEFIEALQDEEEDPKEVVKDFCQARFSTFARNMATIGFLILQEEEIKAKKAAKAQEDSSPPAPSTPLKEPTEKADPEEPAEARPSGRFSTFSKNMTTIGLLLTREDAPTPTNAAA